jgi:glycosyltransferase involved in cell wall biosynthesis
MSSCDISIVTPVFNSVRWIELCLQSVRHALQGQSYEHIVVDGGSTDGTLDYLNQQKDIRLIPGPDKGMYDALNKGMAAARGRIVGHLNADEQYDRAGLAHAIEKLDQTGADAVFGPTIMLDENLNFLYLFNQITVPRPIDADWHMPVQTCSFLFRRQIWERCPYPAEYRVVGDHVWFRRQMKLGLMLVSVRKPIGLFTWHQDDIAKRLGSHSEKALADVNRKSLLMRLTKLLFRFRHLCAGGSLPPRPLQYEIISSSDCPERLHQPCQHTIMAPSLKRVSRASRS